VVSTDHLLTLKATSRISRISLPLKTVPIDCSETSVRNCHDTLRENPFKTAYLILNSCFRVALCLYLATCFRVTSWPMCSGSISVCNPRLLGSILLSSQFLGWPSILIRDATSYHWLTFNYRHSLQPCDAASLNRDSINS